MFGIDNVNSLPDIERIFAPIPIPEPTTDWPTAISLTLSTLIVNSPSLPVQVISGNPTKTSTK